MKSMTGYGKGVTNQEKRSLTVEMKSVNNRYLEINCRMPKALAPFEDLAKKEIKKVLSRGSVDVFFTYQSELEKSIEVDLATAQSYLEIATKLKKELGVKNDITTVDLMKINGVVTETAGQENEEELAKLVAETVALAVQNLNKMRLIEGETVTADLKRLIDNIDGALDKAQKRAPLVVEEYREKLRERITNALAGVELDQARLINEVAFFADKADINEEISRLHSHIAQFNDALVSDGPQGRNLDFVSQEIGREINTMGSKSNDSELTALVIYMKNELEKIKEQIRNVE
ncbi:MAG: YicC family protein [Clostridia bacterium]|nr:YicC family protein [Clostridia bacterium]